jgi:GMP synthase-like glutamine amidotransferase
MFLSLLEKAFQSSELVSTITKLVITITITVYEAKQGIYPQSKEWDSYDGILLPGSFSSAYDDDEWIQKLKSVIQNEIHAKGRKTLAVCFGHQVFAHSFRKKANFADDKANDNIIQECEGFATSCPAGLQVGRRSFTIENEWMKLDSDSTPEKCLSMLYTHGDLVLSLPKDCAVSLGGTATVPIQAAAYFAPADKDSANVREFGIGNDQSRTREPYAFTFQGHPEYDTDVGIETFTNILYKMEDNKKLQHEASMKARNDALEALQSIENDCVDLMKVVGSTFGWMDPVGLGMHVDSNEC